MTPKGETEVLREKCFPVPVFPPHGMTWDQARIQTMNTEGFSDLECRWLYVHTFIYLCNVVRVLYRVIEKDGRDL